MCAEWLASLDSASQAREFGGNARRCYRLEAQIPEIRFINEAYLPKMRFMWIWQLKAWPNFEYDAETLQPALASARMAQGACWAWPAA